MKQTLTIDTLSQFNDDSANTPTTLKDLTLLFNSDDCLKRIQSEDFGSSANPILPTTLEKSNSEEPSKTFFNLAGGTTTVVIPNLGQFKTDDIVEDNSEESDEEFIPPPRMLRNHKNPKTNPGNNTKVTKRRGNKKDDYSGLPPPERQRLMLKRERNKEAAARCRQKKVDLTNELQQKVQVCIKEKEALEEEIKQLQCQKKELELALQTHHKVCGLNFAHNRMTYTVQTHNNLPDEYESILEAPVAKRRRPETLVLSSHDRSSEVDNSIPCFDNFLTPCSGLTPMPSGLTPMHYNEGIVVVDVLNTPMDPTASLQTPGEHVDFISL